MRFCKRLFVLLITIIFLWSLAYYLIGGYKKHINIVKECSQKYGVSIYLILAVIKTESSFNETAISNKGAVGLMQILPSTCEFICEKYGIENESLLVANFNVKVGTLYLKYLIEKFGSERVAVIAYNAGEGRVTSWLKNGQINDIPYGETKRYAKKVFLRKRAYKAIILI
ncbi:MAG: lytic transglycosylase domain-containing protein [Clostridia bacterium]|nr:lytic transglycosylase domain-containing protein [Clostridia bacterium]